jgi:hypothetical protein
MLCSTRIVSLRSPLSQAALNHSHQNGRPWLRRWIFNRRLDLKHYVSRRDLLQQVRKGEKRETRARIKAKIYVRKGNTPLLLLSYPRCDRILSQSHRTYLSVEMMRDLTTPQMRTIQETVSSQGSLIKKTLRSWIASTLIRARPPHTNFRVLVMA